VILRDGADLGDHLPPRYGRIVPGAMVGVAGAIAAAGGGVAMNLPDSPWAYDMLATGLTISSILIVPISIFSAVVGAMFPAFGRATPVTLVRASPASTSITLLSATLSYGIVSGLLAGLWPVTVLSGLVFGVLLLFASVAALALVRTSVQILDPVGLAEWIAGHVPNRQILGRKRATDLMSIAIWGDLCRLVRGYNDARRVEAAAQVLDIQAIAFERRLAVIPKMRIEFASRVIGECQAGDHPILNAAITRFTATTHIEPDPRARARKEAERRLGHAEPTTASTLRFRLGPLTVEL
jgi:hypothetical protein